MIKKIANVFTFFFMFTLLFCGLSWGMNQIHIVNLPCTLSWNTIEFRYIEIYGGIQKLLGKREIENFTICKTNTGRLVSPREQLTDDTISESIEQIMPIIRHLEDNDIPYVYVRNALPISSETELPIGIVDYSGDNFDRLGEMLAQRDVKTIDINSSLRQMMQGEELFYKTDHHWNGDASFNAFIIISDYLSSNDMAQVSSKILSRENYERIVIANSFLGSYGIKVGRLYTGKDDYVYYVPKYYQEVEFIAHKEDGNLMVKQKGEWFESYLNQEILADDNYNNKYDVFLYGNGGINVLRNYSCSNSKKLLLISHSYGRPIAPYLSLIFSEVRQIDPQPGRFHDNFIEYIDDYKPDCVIILVESDGEIIGDYKH